MPIAFFGEYQKEGIHSIFDIFKRLLIHKSLGKMERKQKLLAFLDSLHPLSDESFQALIEPMEEVSYIKGKLLTKKGEVENYLYLVLEGYQRAYFIHSGNEYTMAFSRPFTFSGIPASLITREPSKYNLGCITDSRFLRLSYDKLQELMLQNKEINDLIWKGTGEVLSRVSERYQDVLALSIEERFKKLMSDNAYLLHEIPRRDLAAYLNMDYTNFSKLVNRIRI